MEPGARRPRRSEAIGWIGQRRVAAALAVVLVSKAVLLAVLVAGPPVLVDLGPAPASSASDDSLDRTLSDGNLGDGSGNGTGPVGGSGGGGSGGGGSGGGGSGGGGSGGGSGSDGGESTACLLCDGLSVRR